MQAYEVDSGAADRVPRSVTVAVVAGAPAVPTPVVIAAAIGAVLAPAVPVHLVVVAT
jgi:hypothetical protein